MKLGSETPSLDRLESSVFKVQLPISIGKYFLNFKEQVYQTVHFHAFEISFPA